MEEKKLMKTANILDTIAKVCAGILRAVGVVLIVFAILVLVLGEKMYDVSTLSLNLAFVKLYLAEGYGQVTGLVQVYTVLGLLVGSVVCFAACYGLKYLRKILAPMKVGRPFEAETPACFKKIAWVVLGSGAAVQIIGLIERVLLTKIYPMEQIFASEAIEKIEYVNTVDFTFVLVFGILMLLSYIFAYGQTLQKESDETL